MMPIKYVNFQSECTHNSPEWTKYSSFKQKGDTVTKDGIKYVIVSKESRTASTIEQFGYNILYGLTAVYEPENVTEIRDIATKGFARVYFAVPLTLNPYKDMADFIASIWAPKKNISMPEAQIKMWKNGVKALREHSQENGNAYTNIQEQEMSFGNFIKKTKDIFGSYSPLESALPNLENFQNAAFVRPLNFTISVAADIGKHRPTMEDAHFYIKISQGILCGVFDGHGGEKIADYASQAFQERFESALSKAKGNVHEAFETLFSQIQTEIANFIPLWDMGSTALITFIDKSNTIYTATLGDSEAYIYRNIDGQMKSIPLSCVRNWSSRKDAARAAKVLNNSSIADSWPKAKDSKLLRFPSNFTNNVNVSRAFGDIRTGYISVGPGMSHKPKISMNKLHKNDILILACDGLFDYVLQQKLVKEIAMNKDTSPNLAEHLVNYAIKSSLDNVTVLAIKALKD